MSWFVVVFLLLMWLPGHLVLRTPQAARALKRGSSWAERVFLEVSISALILLWLAVTLATLGLMQPLVLAGAGGLVTAALWYLGRGAESVSLPSFAVDSTFAAAALIIVAGAILYQPQFEQIIGGRDPITYVVSGIHTGQTGAWVSHDEEVMSMPERTREAFLGPDMRESFGHWGPRFIGWYLMDPETARVVPQGLPLFPSTIAVGYQVADIQGAVRTTGVLAVFAALSLFFLARRLFGPAAAVTAVAMLMVSPAQVWFSRYANAEVLTQFLIVIGLMGFVLYRKSDARVFALLSALAFGLAWQAHVWMVLLVLPLGGLLVADLLRGRVDKPSLLYFWAPLTVLGVQALLVYFFVVSAYLQGLYKVFRWSTWVLLPLVVGVVFVLAALWWVGRRRASDGPDASDDAEGSVGWLRYAAAALVVVASVYGYWLRPLTIPAFLMWRVESVPRLTLAVGVAGFGFAVAGIVMVLISKTSRTTTLMVTGISLALMVPVLYEPNITPALMWSLRRYQSWLPLVFLFAAVPLWGPGGIGSGARGSAGFGRLVAVVVSAYLVVPLALQSATYRGFKQPGEMIELVNNIADSVEDDAVLVFEARSGWGALDFAPALRYWKGFDVVWLRQKVTDGAALNDFVLRQTQAGRPVYFFTQGFNYYVPQPRMVPHQRWRVERTQLEETLGELPQNVVTATLPLASYKLFATGANGPLNGGLDVGEWDDIYVGEALPWEQVGELTARWTKANGFFWLPGLDASAQRITVHAGTVHNSGSVPRTLTATLDGVVLGEIPIVQEWTDYVFEVPSDWQPQEGSAPRLVLSTEALQPDTVTGNGDTRYLGVLVNAILWQ